MTFTAKSIQVRSLLQIWLFTPVFAASVQIWESVKVRGRVCLQVAFRSACLVLHEASTQTCMLHGGV